MPILQVSCPLLYSCPVYRFSVHGFIHADFTDLPPVALFVPLFTDFQPPALPTPNVRHCGVNLCMPDVNYLQLLRR